MNGSLSLFMLMLVIVGGENGSLGQIKVAQVKNWTEGMSPNANWGRLPNVPCRMYSPGRV